MTPQERQLGTPDGLGDLDMSIMFDYQNPGNGGSSSRSNQPRR
jgi:hypothetical protein